MFPRERVDICLSLSHYPFSAPGWKVSLVGCGDIRHSVGVSLWTRGLAGWVPVCVSSAGESLTSWAGSGIQSSGCKASCSNSNLFGDSHALWSHLPPAHKLLVVRKKQSRHWSLSHKTLISKARVFLFWLISFWYRSRGVRWSNYFHLRSLGSFRETNQSEHWIPPVFQQQ